MNTLLSHLLAVSPLTQWAANWNRMPPGRQKFVIGLGVLTLIALSVMVWAIFFHVPSHHNSRRPPPRKKPDEEDSHRKRRKWRRKRREHRPRNPTLADTGGLPPPRSEDAAD